MSNMKQKARAKGDAQEQSLTAKTGNAVTPITSMGFVRTMLEATMGTFLYLRYIFPDDNFETMELRKEALATESPVDPTLPSTLIAEDSQIPVSQQVSKPLVTRRVISDGSKQTKQFLERLEGITQAVEKGYLRSFILYIILDPDRPNQVLETVTFNFTYSPEGPSCILTRDVNKRAGGGTKTQSATVMTNQQVYKAMKAVIRDFVKESQDMPDLPKKRCLNFKVFYTDDAPSDYEVSGFEDSTGDTGLVFGTHDRYEVPAEMAAHTVDTSYHGFSVRLASIAGHLKPATNIEALTEKAAPRSDEEQKRQYEKHLNDADRRNIVWDAEISAIDQTSHTVPLGYEDQDCVLHPLPASQARSEAESDENCLRMYAKGHGERQTNLKLVHDSEPWGVEDMFIATQEVGKPSAHQESQETLSVPSDPETQNRPRSAQVTGSLSQIPNATLHQNTSDSSSASNPLISSDEHTDPSSQEFATSKDTFRGASTAPPAHKLKKARSSRAPSNAPSTGTAPIPRSALIKRPKAKKAAADKAPAKPRAPKKKAGTAAGGTATAKGKKGKSGSDDAPSTGSSADSPAKPKKKAPAKSKKATKAKTPAPANTSDESAGSGDGDEEGEVQCGCGHNPKDFEGDFVQCDGCKFWKHAVCMGIMRLEKLGENFHCVECRLNDLKPTEDEMLDNMGNYHSLCLVRRMLVAARFANQVPGLGELATLLGCGTSDVNLLLKRLVDEGFLRIERSSKSGPKEYFYDKNDTTKVEFSRYFVPGGSKERQEIPALFDGSQLPSSQLPASQIPYSQQYDSQSQSQYRNLSQVPNSQLAALASRSRPAPAPTPTPAPETQTQTQQEDIEVDETPLKSSAPLAPARHRSQISPIPESDSIEEYSTNAAGQGNLFMEVDDDEIEATPVNSSAVSRRYDAKGKRKADGWDSISTRPTARIRSATGMGFIDCPFVEI